MNVIKSQEQIVIYQTTQDNVLHVYVLINKV